MVIAVKSIQTVIKSASLKDPVMTEFSAAMTKAESDLLVPLAKLDVLSGSPLNRGNCGSFHSRLKLISNAPRT